MIEKISFKVFRVSMLLCAVSFLAGIWVGEEVEILGKFAVTFFVIGFAAFLTWLTTMIYKYLDILKKRSDL